MSENEHASGTVRVKRGGGVELLTLHEELALTDSAALDVLELEEGLERLGAAPLVQEAPQRSRLQTHPLRSPERSRPNSVLVFAYFCPVSRSTARQYEPVKVAKQPKM